MENTETEQLNNSTLRMSTSKPNFAESIFQMQKKRIEELMTVKKLRDMEEQAKKIYDSYELNKVIMFNDINLTENINWEFSNFDVESFYNEDNPIIKSDWSESNINPSLKGIEIKGLIFRSKENVKLENSQIEITTNFSLKGESSFWLMLRTEEYFDEFSSVIRISKEENSQNIFISMGTYVRDSYKNLILKNFSKQQLIDFSKFKTKSYKENDSCDIKAYFLDTGDNKISARIVVNDSKIDNNVNSEFFLPILDQRCRLMIAGSGQQCCIKNFLCRINTKLKDEMYSDFKHHSIFSTDKRNCDCCVIF